MNTVALEVRAPELLWRVPSAKRWELPKALCGAGLLNRTEDGNVEFPHEAAKREFLLQAA
jgi:hypothetical protein